MKQDALCRVRFRVEVGRKASGAKPAIQQTRRITDQFSSADGCGSPRSILLTYSLAVLAKVRIRHVQIETQELFGLRGHVRRGRPATD